MAGKVYYGGQAVIEGVMMRGQKHLCTAVRRPNGEIVTDTQPLSPFFAGRPRKTPLLRGIIALIESMVLGIKTLLYSANVALEEEPKGEKMGGGVLWLTMLVGMAAAVGLFFLLPLFLARLFPIGSSVVFHLVEGVIRIMMFIGYLKLVAMAKDIRRVFAYHGAEHKTVNAHENGAPMEVAAVQKFSTAHVRCGTSFLFIILLIAIITFSLVGRPALWIMILSRVVLIPVIAAIGYEVIFFAGRHTRNWLTRIVLKPGLWLQALSTREPDDSQVEVAIAALKQVIAADQVSVAVPQPVPQPETAAAG